MPRASERLRQATGLFADVAASPPLRRLQSAWACSILGTWAFTVAVLVYAYEQNGAQGVGLVGLARWIAAGIVSPFAAVLGDRFDRRAVMIGSDLSRAVLTAGAAGAAFAHAPAAIVYLLTGLMSIAATAFRPAEAALTPLLAETPEQLSAANVVASTTESIGMFAGPAIGGLLLAAANPQTVFAFTAASVVASAFFVARIPAVSEAEDRPEQASEAIVEELLAGARVIARDRRLRLLIALFSAQTFVDGVLGVILVVFAVELQHAGTSMVGFLNAAIGVGGVVGALTTAVLVGRGKLASDFGIGVALFGLPLALAAVWPQIAFSLVVMGFIGIGNTLVDVSGTTLLQRLAANEVLARVFGVLETLFLVTVGVGAILAPDLIAGLGVRGAMVATGLALPVVVVLCWRALRAIDVGSTVPPERLDLLRSIAIFAPLPEATLEQLARALHAQHATSGEEVVRQGDAGERFFIVEAGSLAVLVDGERRAELGPGDVFGEIALLRDVPRTATVLARSDSDLLSLGRDDFVPALTGSSASLAAAHAIMRSRLGM
jgi:MFS family permease